MPAEDSCHGIIRDGMQRSIQSSQWGTVPLGLSAQRRASLQYRLCDTAMVAERDWASHPSIRVLVLGFNTGCLLAHHQVRLSLKTGVKTSLVGHITAAVIQAPGPDQFSRARRQEPSTWFRISPTQLGLTQPRSALQGCQIELLNYLPPRSIRSREYHRPRMPTSPA